MNSYITSCHESDLCFFAIGCQGHTCWARQGSRVRPKPESETSIPCSMLQLKDMIDWLQQWIFEQCLKGMAISNRLYLFKLGG